MCTTQKKQASIKTKNIYQPGLGNHVTRNCLPAQNGRLQFIQPRGSKPNVTPKRVKTAQAHQVRGIKDHLARTRVSGIVEKSYAATAM